MTQDYNLVNFKNIGFLSAQFTEDQLAPIKQEIRKIQRNFDLATPAQHKLAGHIQHEYDLIESKDYLESLFLPFVAEYDRQFNIMKELSIVSKDCPIYLDNAWVNFQEKYEFNPPHNHSGILSFALWIKIPYRYAHEQAMFPKLGSGSISSAGSFSFQYTNSLGGITSHIINLDTESENCAVIFPAKMIHQVDPFYTSDEYRISVSGNFKFKTA